MVFAEKLKLIMQLTQTTNSRLASAINVDPSLISRLRSGDRFISAKSDYLHQMADYFGSKCNDSFRSLTVLELIGGDFGEDIASALERWFLNDDMEPDCENITDFYQPELQRKKRKSVEKFTYFHGDKAIIQAFEFINELIEQSGNVKILKMLSNCTDGPGTVDFFDCCGESILGLAENGTEIIRVVPNFSNLICAVNDIFSSLSILEEGKLNSYYYHDFKEGMFNNMILVVPGIAALFSVSVGMGGVVPTIVTTDSAAISDFDRLFDEYVSHCTQGVKTEPHRHFENALQSFFSKKEDCCNIYDTLPFEWMPEELADSEKEKSFLNSTACSIKDILKTNTVTEIFPLLSPEDVIRGQARMFHNSDNERFYTAKEYSGHLSEIVMLLETEPNYNAVPIISNGEFKGNVLIKRNCGAIKLPRNESGSFGVIDHPSSVSALWQYFMSNTRFNVAERKIQTIEKIKSCIEALK